MLRRHTFIAGSLLMACQPLNNTPTNFSPLSADAMAPSQSESKIVGGNAISISQVPWQARLIVGNSPSCGAAILSPTVILTAQHCLAYNNLSASDIYIAAGKTYQSDINSAQIRAASDFIRYPFYGNGYLGGDIALITLAEPFDLSDPNVAAIEMVTPDDAIAGLTDEGVTALVSGWGLTSEFGGSPDGLRAVEVPIVSLTAARQVYGNNRVGDNELPAGNLQDGGVDSCQGDSGGPFVVPNPEGGYKLAGIVSWGAGCASPGSPGIYARVSSFYSWVNDNAEIADPQPPPPTTLELIGESSIQLGEPRYSNYFIFEVPSNAYQVEVRFENRAEASVGNSALVVHSHADQPEFPSEVNCETQAEGSDDVSCLLQRPQPGLWVASVQGQQQGYAGDLKIWGAIRDGVEAEEFSLVTQNLLGDSLGLDAPISLQIEVPKNYTLEVNMTEVFGDSDLFLGFSPNPSLADFHCKGISNAYDALQSHERCVLQAEEDMLIYIQATSPESFAEANFEVLTYQAGAL